METFLKIENIKLWARVGVLDEERELGQLFILDIFLWTNFEKCTVNDDIEKTIDYSKLVQILKDQSKKIYCFTIEKYSNEKLNIPSSFNFQIIISSESLSIRKVILYQSLIAINRGGLFIE